MKSTQSLLTCNVNNLNEGLELLESLDEHTFTVKSSRLHDSSIGEHMRHIIEHYISFLNGFESRQINYDARERDLRISDTSAFACDVIKKLTTSLNALPSNDETVDVRASTSLSSDEETQWSQSTLKRELQFLQAHTIHHYALISMILRFHGVDSGSSFGIAPSTLKHRLAIS